MVLHLYFSWCFVNLVLNLTWTLTEIFQYNEVAFSVKSIQSLLNECRALCILVMGTCLWKPKHSVSCSHYRAVRSFLFSGRLDWRWSFSSHAQWRSCVALCQFQFSSLLDPSVQQGEHENSEEPILRGPLDRLFGDVDLMQIHVTRMFIFANQSMIPWCFPM